MMLLHLQALDDANGLALVDNDLAGIASTYLRPSIFLTFLVALVVLSSIRAAVLFMRAPKANQAGKVVLVRQVKSVVSDEKPIVGSSKSSSASSSAPSSNSSSASGHQAPDRQQRPPMSSWLWGLVKWDRFPSLPVNRPETTMSRTERGFQTPLSSPPPRRTGHYEPTAMYQSDVPLSMAKLIMSRHTFRRPASRPPPARSTNAPQYQRRLPSMV